MEIHFECPHCDVSVAAPAESAGKTVNCPKCCKSFLIPDSGRSEPRPFKTPRHIRPDELAPRAVRFVGHLIDKVVHLALFVASVVAICALSGQLEQVTRLFSGNMPFWILGVASLSASFLTTVVNVYFWHTRGQSIGKIVVGTKIVKSNGERANLVCILCWRELPPLLLGILPGMGGALVLADALFIFQKEKTCLHDYLADTRVVNADVPVSV